MAKIPDEVKTFLDKKDTAEASPAFSIVVEGCVQPLQKTGVVWEYDE